MSKKRDNDLKSENRKNFENRGPSGQISRSTVENRDITDESEAVVNTNRVSVDMARSNQDAIDRNGKR